MPVLAHHDTITGPLTAADLEAARRDNPGSIWHSPHRLLPHGCDQQSRYATRQWPDTIPTDWDSCAPEGGIHADPVPSAVLSMRRHDRIRYRVALALLLAVAGYLTHLAWPLLA